MIKLIKGYPYDNTYDYIKLHANKTDQENYFNTFDHIFVDEGEEEGYIKEGNAFIVEYNYDYLVDQGVNYVIWSNGHKDLYCFIIAKEFVDEENTRLYYEIDVLNTYLFDIKLKKSFVERKKCTINEITDFDEGIYLGEHTIVEDTTVLNKTSKYFAMFNGFKEQELIFNDNGKLTAVVDIPYSTSKPLTTIDDVQYPLYFMPLYDQSEYKSAVYEDVGISTGGSVVYTDAISKKIFRFLKGYEAFASEGYMDSGGVPTIGYGVTDTNSYWGVLFPQCTEEKASQVLAATLYNNYASPLYKDMQSLGVDMATVKQNHFDAFLSLCYNGGLGAVTTSPMYSKWINNPNDSTICDQWYTWYIRDNNGTVLEGLKDRRSKEVEIFQNNNYIYKPIGIVVDNVGTISGVITDNNGNGYIPDDLGGEL